MANYKLAFVAFDEKQAVAIAEDGRGREVGYFGEIEMNLTPLRNS
jgi:hypothetical protein